MKINTRTVWQMDADGMHIVEQDSYEYSGPVSQAFGGKSSTTSVTETTQEIQTQNVESGVAIIADGDVEFTQSVTDLGAIQGAFEFAESVGDQAGELAERAIAISAGAVKTVGEATRSDTSQALVKIAGFAAAAVGIFFIAQSFRRA